MKLNEWAKRMNVSTPTAFKILSEHKGMTKLSGCWYANARGLKILEQMTPSKSSHISQANHWLTEGYEEEDNGDSLEQTAKADGSTIAIVKDTLRVIREEIKKLQDLTLNNPNLEAEIVFNAFTDSEHLDDILLNIDSFIDAMEQGAS